MMKCKQQHVEQALPEQNWTGDQPSKTMKRILLSSEAGLYCGLLTAFIVLAACQPSATRSPQDIEPVSVVRLNLFEDIEPSPDEPSEIPRGAMKALKTDGPVIQVYLPEPGSTFVSPGRIDIRFEPEDERAVDIDSFRLKARKGFLWIDISKKVKEYIAPEGIIIEDADLGGYPGRYRLRMSIAYEGGGKTEQEFEWTLVDDEG